MDSIFERLSLSYEFSKLNDEQSFRLLVNNCPNQFSVEIITNIELLLAQKKTKVYETRYLPGLHVMFEKNIIKNFVNSMQSVYLFILLIILNYF